MDSNPAPSSSISNSAAVTPTSEKHELQIYLALTVAVFIILGIIVAHIILKNQSEALVPATPSSAPLVESTPIDPAKAWMKVEGNLAAPTTTLGQPITLHLNGSSEGRSITGFDILLSYYATEFTLANIKETNTAFQLFKGVEKRVGDVVIVPLTFTLVAEGKTGIAFAGDNLADVTLTPVKVGKATVSILPSLDNKTTKFVDDQVKVVIPQVQSVEVTVQP